MKSLCNRYCFQIRKYVLTIQKVTLNSLKVTLTLNVNIFVHLEYRGGELHDSLTRKNMPQSQFIIISPPHFHLLHLPPFPLLFAEAPFGAMPAFFSASAASLCQVPSSFLKHFVVWSSVSPHFRGFFVTLPARS